MPAEGQYKTAPDMAIFARRYIENRPEALATTPWLNTYNESSRATENPLQRISGWMG
jgi:D-alanyl-D-alanine carboxypeptidase